MERAIRKSETLIEALPYIRAFRNKVIVIKLGGSAQDDPEVLRRIFTDITFMISVGMYPVVVHGGGKRITQAMAETGKKAVFIQGQRVTDAATMEIVARVLIDEVGRDLIELMRQVGGEASPLNGRDHRFLRAIKKTLPDHPEVDLGFVGEPVAIDAVLIRDLVEKGIVPFIAPVACGCGAMNGKVLYNVNGDTASALIARDLHAEKLVFFLDTMGIYRDRHDPTTLLSHLTQAEAQQLIAEGKIDGGMIPKVEAAFYALQGGVRKVHIVAGSQPHALLLEIFTDRGVGTEIVP